MGDVNVYAAITHFSLVFYSYYHVIYIAAAIMFGLVCYDDKTFKDKEKFSVLQSKYNNKTAKLAFKLNTDRSWSQSGFINIHPFKVGKERLYELIKEAVNKKSLRCGNILFSVPTFYLLC